jgi:hypothetical protein
MSLVKALIINKDAQWYTPIVVMFNPNTLKVKTVTRYADLKTLNTEVTTKKQFIKPENDTLTVELFFDTTGLTRNTPIGNIGVPVGGLVKPILDLAKVAKGKSEPPKIIFAYSDFIFPGFIVSIDQTYEHFNSLGMAMRATLTLTILHCEFDPEGVVFDKPK